MQALTDLRRTVCSFFHRLFNEISPVHHHPHFEAPSPERHLHVLTCITNPVNYESRVRLYHEFAERMSHYPNVTLWTIEGAYEGRAYQVTQPDHPHHVQVFMRDEIWHKENLINVLFERHVPKDAQYIAWVDADVIFTRPDWVEATLDALDRHPIVQLFSQCVDLDSHFQIANRSLGGETMVGMVYAWHQNGGQTPCAAYGRLSGHCGYAWAARRDALETLEGLLDFSIVGSADFQMACALMGSIEDSVTYPASENYRVALREWGARAKRLTGVVGYIDGLVLHNWHGFKSKRGYNWRVNIMTKQNFAPQRDLIKDEQGIYCWNRGNPDHDVRLQDELKAYFRYRNEDAPSDDIPAR